MKLNLARIKEVINRDLSTLNKTYHVKKIGVFGSVARADNTEKSDVDMLVEFSEPIGFFKFIQLEEYLGKILGKKVDLVTKRALKPTIKEEILQEVSYV